ncbi:MAG TPA: LysM peptidoglycan-binding domain-containing protein, partial [Candidatus Hydrogenedentes bacterium]|nr:LysM peptidoglycan-binding domain-containing protein [Candidatus Hydrogenedentota bacterium]
MPEATRSTVKDRLPGTRRSRGVGLAMAVLAASWMTVLAGCQSAGVQRAVAHFRPAPRAEVGATELEPVDPAEQPAPGERSYSPLPIPDPLPAPVEREIVELTTEYPKTFQNGLNRGAKYEEYLRARLRAAGMPEDLVYLAMVESMYRPDAKSPAGACGMWQFMTLTGRRFKLRIDHYVDERYDVPRSTEAAIGYLTALHDYFEGSWAHAITAYNMGEGGLSRAMAANGGERDIWRLISTPPASDRIKLEAKKYYARLLAYMVVTRDLGKYGFEKGTLAPGELAPGDFAPVRVEGMYSLAKLDEALGYPPGTLSRHNPALIRGVTPPSGGVTVHVPGPDRERFETALRGMTPMKSSPKDVMLAGGDATHRVRKGETLATIAQKYGVSVQAIAKANKLKSVNRLSVNQKLLIPGASARGGSDLQVALAGSAPPAERTEREASAPEAPRKETPVTHTVKKGETPAGIARNYKISLASLQEWNGLGGKSVIQVGQKLVVGKSAAPAREAAPAADAPAYHVVRKGEYPAAIAKMYEMELGELLRANNLTTKSTLQVGDRLVVARVRASAPAPRTETAKEAPAAAPAEATEQVTIKHVVQRGETLSAIAARHKVSVKDLMALNKMTSKSVLKAGQELMVRTEVPAGGGGGQEEVTVAKAESGQGKKIAHKVAAGDLTTSIRVEGRDEPARLLEALRAMQDNLETVVAGV